MNEKKGQKKMEKLKNNIKTVDKKVAKKQHIGKYIMNKWKIAGIIGIAAVVVINVVRSLEPDVLAQNESTVNRIYLNADEIYEDDIEKVTKIFEEGMDTTENSEEIKTELDELNAKKVNVTFMQKVYDLMETENYEALRELADSEEADRILTEIQEGGYIYIPGDSMRLNGMGAGIYKYDADNYYFFYGNYVEGVRSGQGTSFMKISEEDKGLYYFEGVYRTFDGEWKNDAPNGYGREEFVYLNADAYGKQSGNVVSEGNLKDGIWDGEIQCKVFYSSKTPVLVEFEMEGNYRLENGKSPDSYFIGEMAVLYDENGNLDRWIEGYLEEEEIIGTIGYGNLNMDEIMVGFGVLQ